MHAPLYSYRTTPALHTLTTRDTLTTLHTLTAHMRHLNLTCAPPTPDQPRADSKPLEAGALRVCAAAACSLAPLDRPACHTRLPLLVTALLKVLAIVRTSTHDYTLCTMHYALCTMHYALCTMLCALCTMHLLCTYHVLTPPQGYVASADRAEQRRRRKQGGQGRRGRRRCARPLAPPEAATLRYSACNPM